ncbi:MAG: hypothetical protein FJ298_05170 [Planctomycetes bacterium]|nr:hypothetical protein [Planctomycetota bacterium]
MNRSLSLWLRTPPAPLTLLAALALGLAAVGWSSSSTSQTPPTTQATPMVVSQGGTADSNGRMVAVTGTDITGASVLYLVDTEKMRLAVYAAASTGSYQGVRLVGARRIELDMELNGYNDKSEYPYGELEKLFAEKGLLSLPAEKPRGQ